MWGNICKVETTFCNFDNILISKRCRGKHSHEFTTCTQWTKSLMQRKKPEYLCRHSKCEMFVAIHAYDEITNSWKPRKHKIGTNGNLTNAVKEAIFTQAAPLSLGDQFANRCTALLVPPCISTLLVTCSNQHYWKKEEKTNTIDDAAI